MIIRANLKRNLIDRRLLEIPVSDMVKSRSRVLFVASSAGCPRVWKMASTLAKSNFEVTILEWDRDAKLPRAEYIGSIYVHRAKLKATYGLKLFVELPIWWVYVFLFILVHHPTIVQPQNLDNLLPTLVATRIRKRRVVYDIADVYDAFVPSNMVSVRRLISWLEGTLTGIVDAVIIADESRFKQIRLAKTPEIINNSPPDRYAELRSLVPTQRTINPKFILFYAGILSEERGLDTIVAAVQDLDDIKLVVAGFGAMESKFLSMIKGKHNIKFLGRIPYDDVLRLTCSSDCLIALYDPRIPNDVFASPNKLFEAMMCQKPIIVNRGTNMANIVRKERCGVEIDYGNVEGLKKAITSLKRNKALGTLLGKNGRHAYLEKYSGALMEQRLLRLYFSIETQPEM